MPARPVHVAMRQFDRRRGADFHDLDIEGECHAGERMISVHGDVIVLDFCDRDDGLPLRTFGMKLLPDRDIRAFELRARHAGDQRVVARAIAFFRRNRNLEGIALDLAGERIFQPADNIARPVQVGERFRAAGRVELVSVWIGEGVMNADDGLVGDLHE